MNGLLPTPRRIHRLFMLAVLALCSVALALPSAKLAAQEGKPARTLKSGGRQRTFHLYVPESLDRSKPAPLLLCFHGAGGNGLGEMNAFRRLADRHQFLLVGPDGINKRWNAGCEDEIQATGGADDVAFVRDMLAAIGGEFQVDTDRVYAYGFSNGAAVAHRLAAELPQSFAGIAAAGATMAQNTKKGLQPGPPVAILIMVGAEDPMFGTKGDLRGGTFLTASETARLWAEHNACEPPAQVEAPVPHTRWAASAGAGEVELWVVEGAGHTPAMSKVFDTAEESWRFLARQRRPNGMAGAVYTLWPFDAAEAERRQLETAKAIGQPVELKTPLAPNAGSALIWRLIPAGEFMMGSPATESGHEGDERQHSETISEPFYMLATQLTVEQYRALMHADPAEGSADSDATIPAGISYRDTVDKVLPALAKRAPEGWKVILPDQARLEYAARAGVATMNPGGDRPEDAAPFAWTRENSEQKVHPVAQKRPNPWGLHDVIGNCWHWFWRAGDSYGDASTKDHIVYGGTYHAESGGNGARLANIMISDRAEGARFALIRAETPPPKGHPETRQQPK